MSLLDAMKRWCLQFTINGMYRDMRRATNADHKAIIGRDIYRMELELKTLSRKS